MSHGRYEPLSEDEAAALGRALLAEMRGEPLTPSQRALLRRSRSESPAEVRAPTPVVEEAELLLSLPRGEDAELRLSIRRYKGSAPFLDVRRFERGPGGAMRATRQGATVRAAEIGRLLSALVEAAGRLDIPEKTREDES